MGAIKITFDEDNLKEIKIICSEVNDEEDKKGMLETIETFFINTIETSLAPEITKLDGDEVGFLIKSEEHGEEILTNILRYFYIISKTAKDITEKVQGAENESEVEQINFDFIRPFAEETANMDYHELAKLIGDYQKD